MVRHAAIYSLTYYDVYTSGDTERIRETERMQMKYLKNDVLLKLPEEGERHDKGNRQIMEGVGSGIY